MKIISYLVLFISLIISSVSLSYTIKITNNADSDVDLTVGYGGQLFCNEDTWKIKAHTTLDTSVGLCCTRTTNFTSDGKLIPKPQDADFPGNMAEIHALLAKNKPLLEKALGVLVSIGSFGTEGPVRESLSELTCESWSAEISGHESELKIERVKD